jgi:hypothetical protein
VIGRKLSAILCDFRTFESEYYRDGVKMLQKLGLHVLYTVCHTLLLFFLKNLIFYC